MKRYNQGLYKFGPMEQCDDGEWVKYSDVESQENTLKRKILHMTIVNRKLKKRLEKLNSAGISAYFLGLFIGIAAGIMYMGGLTCLNQ